MVVSIVQRGRRTQIHADSRCACRGCQHRMVAVQRLGRTASTAAAAAAVVVVPILVFINYCRIILEERVTGCCWVVLRLEVMMMMMMAVVMIGKVDRLVVPWFGRMHRRVIAVIFCLFHHMVRVCHDHHRRTIGGLAGQQASAARGQLVSSLSREQCQQ